MAQWTNPEIIDLKISLTAGAYFTNGGHSEHVIKTPVPTSTPFIVDTSDVTL